MATRLRLVDKADRTVVRFDFNDATGAANPYAVKTTFGRGGAFALNAPERELVRFSPPSAPGGFTTFTRDEVTASSWGQRLWGAGSYDNLVAAANELGRLLRNGECDLEWMADGSTQARFADILESPAPALFRGEPRELVHAIRHFDSPEGVELLVWRQPWLEGATLDPASNVLVNPTLLHDGNHNGRPDGWAWASAADISAESIDAATESYKFTIAIASVRNFRQSTAAATAAPGDVWSASVLAKVSSGTSARARAAIEYLDNTGTAIGGGDTYGTLTTLTSTEQTLTVTSAAAPAGTDRVRMLVRLDPTDANPNVIHLRRAQLEEAPAASSFRVGPQTVYNDPEAATARRVLFAWNGGSLPTPAELLVEAEAGAALTSVTVGRLSSRGSTGKRLLADYANGAVYEQTDTLVEMGLDTTRVADADASGGFVASVSYATSPTVLARRYRMTRATVLEARRGEWNVYARLRATMASKQWIQLRWGPSDTDPAVEVLDEVSHETTDAVAGGYVDLLLGTIRVPEDTTLSDVTFEVWSRKESGNGVLRVDCLTFAPTERLSVVALGSPPADFWEGDTLATPAGTNAPALAYNKAYLDAVAEGAGNPPSLGTVWPVGTHTVEYSVTTQNNAKLYEVLSYARICKTGGVVAYPRANNGAYDEGDVVHPITKNGRTYICTTAGTSAASPPTYPVVDGGTVADGTVVWTETTVASQPIRSGTASPWTPSTVKVTAALEASKEYDFRVVYTGATGSGRQVVVFGIRHQFSPTVTVGEMIRADARVGLAQHLAADSSPKGDLTVRGHLPLMLEPGLSALYLHFADAAILGYTEPESKLTRAPLVMVTHAPRWHT